MYTGGGRVQQSRLYSHHDSFPHTLMLLLLLLWCRHVAVAATIRVRWPKCVAYHAFCATIADKVAHWAVPCVAHPDFECKNS